VLLAPLNQIRKPAEHCTPDPIQAKQMPQPDKSELKERVRDSWTSAADGWRRRDDLLREGAAPVSDRMLELSGISSGSRLLDIASGTGEPAISAARIVGESGKVVGTDLVDEMLAVAREKVAKTDLSNIEFHCIDAEALDFPAGSFDAVTIRWGLMFMPDPHACLIAAHKALKQNGRISLACWAAPEKNPFLGVLLKTLSKYMEIPVPSPGTPYFCFFRWRALPCCPRISRFQKYRAGRDGDRCHGG